MKEFTVLIWFILFTIVSIVLVFLVKRQKRKLGKYAMIYKLVLLIITLLVSFLTYWLFVDTIHLIWISRIVILLLGVVNVYFLFKRPWTKRDEKNYKEDSFFIEFLFVCLSSFSMATIFVAAPQITGIIDYGKDVSSTLVEAPLIFLLPFLLFKLNDFVCQIPFKEIQKPWLFPIEAINPKDLKWKKDLVQVNFEVFKSLKDEYNIMSWKEKPWIEAPQELQLSVVFCIAMQKRREKRDLRTIQDLGNEYGEDVKFCWMFSLRKIWYKPSTWFKYPRYLDPDLSIIANKIKKGDIVFAQRIPYTGINLSKFIDTDNIIHDSDKTVIVKR